MARGYAEAQAIGEHRLAHARAFSTTAILAYWDALCLRSGACLDAYPGPLSLPSLPMDVHGVAESTGRLVAEFPPEDAGYLIGSIYAIMLPRDLRSSMGVYYTPPPLVARMLDLAEAAGFDYTNGTAIDPACGGGAFLAPVALRMLARSDNASADWTIRSLAKRLRGIEIDPFAAWMTHVLLEAAVLPLCIQAKYRLPQIVTVGDALQSRDFGTYDLVIGNPPYGRITLDGPTRQRFGRSLYGHANLYGLFTDLALQMTKPGGVLAYLTPTSFLGGQYFKALRQLLVGHASPVAFDFVVDRNGVFDDVLQETMLTVYTRGKRRSKATVSAVIPQGLNTARIENVGQVKVPGAGDPWLLPRTSADIAFIQAMSKMPTRLSDLGYTISTGPLVWNRHKPQLKTRQSTSTLPLIWAESVTASGFVFKAERRNHMPFFNMHSGQSHLVTRQSCILMQRTTSKEQERRLVAALLPQAFLDEHGGAVIENHLNVVQASPLAIARISQETMVSLLNSVVIDQAFRCISGSVAVSAYELNALPLPSIEQLQGIEQLVTGGAERKFIDRAIAVCYGIA